MIANVLFFFDRRKSNISRGKNTDFLFHGRISKCLKATFCNNFGLGAFYGASHSKSIECSDCYISDLQYIYYCGHGYGRIASHFLKKPAPQNGTQKRPHTVGIVSATPPGHPSAPRRVRQARWWRVLWPIHDNLDFSDLSLEHPIMIIKT